MRYEHFASGFRAIIPFWLGAAPIAFTYVLTARNVGFSNLSILLMSIFIFSAIVQLNTLQLLQYDATSSVILLTGLLLSVHQILLGVVLQKRLTLSMPQRLLAAFLLTDAAYAATIHRQNLNLWYLLGAGCSMFVAWNGFTLLALLVGQHVMISEHWQLDFAIPLIFLMLLIPLLKNSTSILVAFIAASLMVIATWANIGAGSVLLAILPACFIGAWLSQPETSQ
jgi:predicted branched-subunit amino acid permease